jgi:hypothetical protein
LTSQIEFVTGTVSQTTEVTVISFLAENEFDMVFAGHGLELAAGQAGGPLAEFGQPVTLTLAYSDLDVHHVAEEAALVLWWWNGSGWQDALTTCFPAGTYGRDLPNNKLSVPICRTGRYALFGPAHQRYLPVLLAS